MGILPTGFGKSLVFHVLSDVFDFMDGGQTPEKRKSITVVISLPNSLMHYQISKLSHLGAIILDETKKGIDLATLQAREGKLHSSRDSFGKQHKINAQYRCISEKRTLCCSG